MAQEFSKSFYNSKQWRQTREYILKRDCYLCVMCGNAAEEVHHKIHLTPSNINDPMIALHESNLISLCGECHKRIHNVDRRKGCANRRKECANNILPLVSFDEEGNPILV